MAIIENNFSYLIKISKSSRSVRISIHPDGRVVLSIPRYVSVKEAEKFLVSKKLWIINKLESIKNRPERVKLGVGKDYFNLKEQALLMAREKVVSFNETYRFKYKDIKIRNQKSRWGSCSKKGTLTFNYRIALLPPEVADYIVVHELCHLKEFNHSQSFWSLVAVTIPNYMNLKKDLHKYSLR